MLNRWLITFFLRVKEIYNSLNSVNMQAMLYKIAETVSYCRGSPTAKLLAVGQILFIYVGQNVQPHVDEAKSPFMLAAMIMLMTEIFVNAPINGFVG